MTFGLNDLWFYLAVISAYIVGCMVAYFIGFKWGKKAVKWVAGNDSEYEKWSTLINKKGKIWYVLTVLLPIFPDDLLCVVCGAIKFKFSFFMIVNFICRTIGLFFMVEFLKLVGMMNNNGFPWSVLIWGIALLLEIIMLYIFKFKIKGGIKMNKELKKLKSLKIKNYIVVLLNNHNGTFEFACFKTGKQLVSIMKKDVDKKSLNSLKLIENRYNLLMTIDRDGCEESYIIREFKDSVNVEDFMLKYKNQDVLNQTINYYTKTLKGVLNVNID